MAQKLVLSSYDVNMKSVGVAAANVAKMQNDDPSCWTS